MADLPVMLKLQGRRCVVIGGGAVAVRRVRSLLDVGANVVVVSPQVHDELAALLGAAAERVALSILRRPYEPGDLAGASLVVIASDDPQANAAAAAEARQAGALVNRADDPDQGDVAIPAHAHHGPVTLAVHAGGVSATASARIRRELSAALAPHWPAFLEAVAPWRVRIQSAITDPSQRRDRLAALVDEPSLALWRRQDQAALQAHWAALADPRSPGPAARSAEDRAGGAWPGVAQEAS